MIHHAHNASSKHSLSRKPLFESLEPRTLLATISISDSAPVLEGDASYRFTDYFVPSGGGGLDSPEGLVFGPDGNLYVNSQFTHSVLKYDGVSGAYLGEFIPSGSGGLSTPRSLTFGPDGNLYVSAEDTLAVLKYDGRTGSFLVEFAIIGTGNAQLRGMTFGPDGHLYVSIGPERRVARFNGADGSPMGTFVLEGSGGLTNAHGLVFGPDHHLYVASPSLDAVLRYDGTSGDFLGTFVVPASGGLDEPIGVAFGPDGDLYVAGRDSDAIHRYDGSTGAFISAITSAELDAPRYFTFGPDTNIYAGTRFNNEVLRYQPSSQAAFTVNLSSASSTPVFVNYATVGGSALAGSDFTMLSGTLTFAPGQTALTIFVPTIDDVYREDDEMFSVVLSSPSSGHAIANGLGTGTIFDFDSQLPSLPGDYNGNGHVEQGDLDLVLLTWGQPAENVPPTWIGTPANGVIDQDELDTILLNWGTASAAAAAPAQAPLLEARVGRTAESDKVRRIAAAEFLTVSLPEKSTDPTGRAEKRSEQMLCESIFALQHNWLNRGALV